MALPPAVRHQSPISGGRNLYVIFGTMVKVNKSLDHGWAWVVMSGSFTIFTLIMGIDKCMGLVYLELLDRLQGSASSTAWVVSTASAGRLIVAPFTSALCQRYGARRVTIAGGVLGSTGLFLGSFAFNLPFEFFTIGVCYGIGAGLYYPQAMTMTVKYFEKKLGLASGISAAGAGIGMMVFPALYNFLIETFGFTGTLMVLSAINLNIVVVGAIFRPPVEVWVDVKGGNTDEQEALLEEIRSHNNINGSPNGKPKVCSELIDKQEVGNDVHLSYSSAVNLNESAECKDGCEKNGDSSKLPVTSTDNIPANSCESGTHQSSNEKQKTTRRCFRKRPSFIPDPQLLKYPGYITYLTQVMLSGFSQLAFLTFLAPLAGERGASDRDMALLLTISAAVDLPPKILTGLILDIPRFRPHRRHVYNAVIFLNALTVILTPLTSNFVELASVGISIGLLQGVSMSLIVIVIVDVVGRERLSDGIGFAMFARSIPLLCGPALIGYIKDSTSSYNPSFYLCGAVGMCGGFVFLCQFLFCPVPSSESSTRISGSKKEGGLNMPKEMTASMMSLS